MDFELENSPYTVRGILADMFCPRNKMCSVYPCRHSPCHDPDWCEQVVDETENPGLCAEAWNCIMDPSRENIFDDETWEQINYRIERWYAIQEKWHQIDAEIREFHQRRRQEAERRRRVREARAASNFTSRVDRLRIA